MGVRWEKYILHGVKKYFLKFSKIFDFWWWFWLWHCKYQYFIKITCKITSHIQNRYEKSRNIRKFEKIFFWTMQNIFFWQDTENYHVVFKTDGVKNLHKILSGMQIWVFGHFFIDFGGFLLWILGFTRNICKSHRPLAIVIHFLCNIWTCGWFLYKSTNLNHHFRASRPRRVCVACRQVRAFSRNFTKITIRRLAPPY